MFGFTVYIQNSRKVHSKSEIKDNENVFCFLIQRENILNEKYWRLSRKWLRIILNVALKKKEKKFSRFPYFDSVTLVQYTMEIIALSSRKTNNDIYEVSEFLSIGVT